MEKNLYFEKLIEEKEAIKKELEGHDKKEIAIEREFGVKSKEAIKCRERGCDLRNALIDGTNKAISAYTYSVDNRYNILILKEQLMNFQVEEFVRCLKEAGVERFLYAAEGLNVLSNLYDLEKAGYKVSDYRTIDFREKALLLELVK
jgi:hypothetical protein|nr:MAG TPA: hypothetical protein [Caudoviricetes sp.]